MRGDHGYDFIVILAGAVTVVDHQAGNVRELATGGPGEFVAELNILTGERLFTTAVVKEPGSILVVPVDQLQGAIARDQALADLILQTTLRTGVTYRKLDAVGLDRFEGTGVFYTPLAAQDQLSPGEPVVIVGGGNSAVHLEFPRWPGGDERRR